MFSEETSAAPGSVAQVRECTNVLLQIAKGMGIIIDASESSGELDPEEAKKMKDLITAYGLPVDDGITPEEAVSGAMNDKKKRGNTLSVIVVNKIGTSEIRKMSPEEFKSFLEGAKR